MPKANKQQITALAEKGLHALQTLSVQFVSHLIEEGFKGVAIDKIVNSFVRNRAKIVSGVLGSAGLATGAGAASARAGIAVASSPARALSWSTAASVRDASARIGTSPPDPASAATRVPG